MECQEIAAVRGPFPLVAEVRCSHFPMEKCLDWSLHRAQRAKNVRKTSMAAYRALDAYNDLDVWTILDFQLLPSILTRPSI